MFMIFVFKKVKDIWGIFMSYLLKNDKGINDDICDKLG